jgi:hypothetical protein
MVDDPSLDGEQLWEGDVRTLHLLRTIGLGLGNRCLVSVRYQNNNYRQRMDPSIPSSVCWFIPDGAGLQLGRTNIDAERANQIAEKLATNTTLRWLTLGDNRQ